jgi:hypothetical protein
VQEKTTVTAGDELLALHPSSSHVLQALLALSQVGRPEDLPLVESFTKPEHGARVATEAGKTVKAIRAREGR